MNRTEAKRHLDARNSAQAETHLSAALQEKHSAKINAELMAQLSKAQLNQNKLEQAVASASAAVELSRKDPGTLWGAMESLTAIQLAQGDTKAALETLEAMEGFEKGQSKPQLTRLVQSSRRRGTILSGSGRHDDARKAFEESMQFTEQTHGPNHVETANTLAELGAIFRQTGAHSEAQQHLQRALKIYRGTEEFHSAQASESLRNLALSLEESGDLAGATAEYERFVTICERQVGGNDHNLVNARVRLSSLYVRNGRSSAARELLGTAIAALERNQGAALEEALQIMAVAEDQAGRRQEAAACREKAERIAAKK